MVLNPEHRQESPDSALEQSDQRRHAESDPRAKETAEKALWHSLNTKQMEIGSFPSALEHAVQQLPRYKQIRERLERKPVGGYEIFKMIQRAADEPIVGENIPDDGVLVRSMQSGKLECAGRVLIASKLLEEFGVSHNVVMAPGHSMILVEEDADTLAYMDPNNDLYFSFPREALQGYQGAGKIAECRLLPFTPRAKDRVDGMNSIFSHFVVTPPKQGTVRQYLDNVQQALHGQADEFKHSQIPVNPEAANAVETLAQEILGKSDPTVEQFRERTEELQSEAHAKTDRYHAEIIKLSLRHPKREEFISAFIQEVQGDLGESIPYIQHASDAVRREYAERLWELVQRHKTDEIGRME